MIDPLIIILAMGAGLLARQAGLPPLTGYLLAGFALHPLGIAAGELLHAIAEAGVTLLLFTIGLKLDVRQLAKPVVWATTTVHMLLTIAALAPLAAWAAWWLGDTPADPASAVLVAFALSFSSTVFVVKIMEERGEMAGLHARIAISVLVLQDLMAVVFLGASAGQWPSWYAPLLLLVVPMKPLLTGLLARCGHGELLALCGFALAFGGAAAFQMAGVKGDTGALLLGALLAGDRKSTELAKSLLTFKDLFLIGFFLTIGLSGLPSDRHIIIALVLGTLALLKAPLYVLLLTRFRLRARTSVLSAAALANHSEFGLIVISLAAARGMVSNDWTVTIALAVAISFLLAIPLNHYAHRIYNRWHAPLSRLQTRTRLSEEQPVALGPTRILIAGMGRVGNGAYDYLSERFGDAVAGIEENVDKLDGLQRAGRRAFRGDASDRDFWERVDLTQLDLVMLALTNLEENILVAKLLRDIGYHGHLATMARFADEAEQLGSLGVTSVNFFAEAGRGFAEHVTRELQLPLASTDS